MNALRNRNFTVLLSGQLVSTVGNNLFNIALPWYAYVLTGSKADLALMGFFQSLPGIAGLFVGVWVDRWPKKGIMVYSDLIRSALACILFSLSVLHYPFALIIICVMLLQLIGTFFGPASTAILPYVIPAESIPTASGLLQSSSATAQLIGTLSGGTLIATIGAPFLFLVDGATYVVSAISLLFVRVRDLGLRNQSVSGRSGFWTQWLEGVRVIVRSSLLVRIILSAVVVNAAVAPFDIMMTAWIKGTLHGTALSLAYVNAAFFSGIIGGGLMLGPLTRVLSFRALIMAGLSWLGVFIAMIGVMHSIVWCMGLCVGAGLAAGALYGSVGAYLFRLVPESLRGRVFSSLGSLTTMASPLGVAVFGALMVRVSLSLLFVISGGITLMAGLSLLFPGTDDLAALESSDETVSSTPGTTNVDSFR